MYTGTPSTFQIWSGAGIAILLVVLIGVLYRSSTTQQNTALGLPPEPEPPCLLAITATSATAYTRPSRESEVFGTLGLHQVTLALGRTESGWIGFDPGVAQAPNVGLLRLRWLPPETPVSFSPGCPSGPETVPTLDPTACYVMSYASTTVYAAPSATASPVGEFRESYVVVQSKQGEYFSVSSAAAQGGSDITCWVPVASVDRTGTCN